MYSNPFNSNMKRGQTLPSVLRTNEATLHPMTVRVTTGMVVDRLSV